MPHIHEGSFEPADFLVESVALLPRGRALDVATGSGRNAIYLAQMGFDVAGVDISAEAISKASEAARKTDVAVRFFVADLEHDYRIEKGAYDAILCFYYLQRSLIPQIRDGLRVGGMVVYETYIADQARLFGKPTNPDYLLKHNELRDMFRDFRCLRYREGIIDGRKAIASLVAEKV